MVWEDNDPLTGAGRDALFVAPSRRRPRSACATASRSLVRSPHGEMRARVHLAPIRPGNVQAFFPEANPAARRRRAATPISGVPDYNAVVEVVPVR